MRFEIRVGRDYEEHIDVIGRDKVDLAFLGPASYVLLVDKYGRKPLLAGFEVDHSPHLFGVIFTLQNSAITSLSNLRGKRFAFGDVESTMSHIVPRHMLLEAGVPIESLARYQYLGSHNNVALAVLAGDFDAGAVKQEVFEKFRSKGLRSLAISPPVSDHVFVTRSSLPTNQIDQIRDAFLDLKNEPDGPEILTSIHSGMTAFIRVTDGDYDNLRPMMVREIPPRSP